MTNIERNGEHLIGIMMELMVVMRMPMMTRTRVRHLQVIMNILLLGLTVSSNPGGQKHEIMIIHQADNSIIMKSLIDLLWLSILMFKLR